MKKVIGVLLLLFLCTTFIVCIGKNSNKEIYISGSRTVEPLMIKLAEAFEKNYPEYKITIEGVGSTEGVVNTSHNNHIGMVSRPLSEEERQDVVPFFLCKNPIVIVVNKESALDRISKEQLIALYMDNTPVGDITKSISREEQAGIRWAFVRTTTIEEVAPIHKDVEILDTPSKVKSAIAYNPKKLGYINLNSLDDSVKALAYSDGGDYFEPTIENIQNNDYVLYRPFFLVVPKSALEGSTQIFLDFCRSEKAREIIFENGFVPIS